MNARCIAPRILLVILLSGLAPLLGQTDLISEARKALKAGDPGQAVQILEQSSKNLDNNLEAQLILAEGCLALRQNEKAMDYALRAVDLDKQGFRPNRLAGKAYYTRALEAIKQPGATPGRIQGFFEEAVGFLETALKKQPKNVELLALKADALYRSANPESEIQAAADFGKLASLEPGKIHWVLMRIRALRAAGKTQEAVAAANKGLLGNPARASLLILKGDILGTASPPRLQEALAAYALALKAPDLKAPDDATLANHVWGLLGSKKKWQEALKIMRGWAKAHPQSFSPYWWAGFYERQLKDYDAAIKDFSTSFKLSGKRSGNSAVWVGDCYWAKKDHQSAAAWYVKASQAAWQDKQMSPVDRIMGLARVYLQKGQLKEGILFLEKYGLRIAPHSHAMLNNLGLAYRDYSLQHPAETRTLSQKSAAYYKKACQEVVKDQQAAPKVKAQIFNDTAILYSFPQHKMLDWGKAVQLYRKALAFDASYQDALENLGLCMNHLGQYEEALGLFQKVLKKEPGRHVSLQGLAEARKGLGQKSP